MGSEDCDPLPKTSVNMVGLHKYVVGDGGDKNKVLGRPGVCSVERGGSRSGYSELSYVVMVIRVM